MTADPRENGPRAVPLHVVQAVAGLAQVVDHRPAGGTNWRITVEANGEHIAVIENDVKGLRVSFEEATRRCRF